MKKIFTFLILGLSSCLMLSQSTITVDNSINSAGEYTDLQQAINEASPGDTIQVHPSPTAYGAIEINKPLVLIGLGHNPALPGNGSVATIGAVDLTGNCANTTIQGLKFTGNIQTQTPITNIANIIIKNNYLSGVTGNANATVQGWTIQGNIIEGSVNVSNASNWLVSNNIIKSGSYSFLSANGSINVANNLIILVSSLAFTSCDGMVFNNNIVYLTSGATEIGMNVTTLNASNNLVYSGDGFTVPELDGTNNINNEDPQFVDASPFDFLDYYNNDYHLQASSPGANAGLDGTDVGIYGGNYDFDINGRPYDIPYMLTLTIFNPSVDVGGTLNVHFSAQKNP